MFSQLRFLLFESERRTFICWWNTLLIATRGKPARKLRPPTRRPSDYLSHTRGQETFASYKTSSNDPSSCAKPKSFRWMKVGCLNSPLRRQPRTISISRRRWPHKKRKSSKRPCGNARDECSDPREPPRS